MTDKGDANGEGLLYKEMGARLRIWRKQFMGKHQQEMADIVGVAGNAISLWERGGGITFKNLLLIGEKSGVSLDWLVYGESNECAALWIKLVQLPEEKQRHVFRHLHGLIDVLGEAEPQSVP